MEKRATVFDIANRAHVSIATVSRVIQSSPHVQKETRERVLQAMRDLNYTYNAVAANFSQRQSNSISVILPEASSNVFSMTIAGIQCGIQNSNYHLLISDTFYDPDIELKVLQQSVEQRCAGILLLGYSPKNEKEVLRICKSNTPLILVWEISAFPIDYIGIDHYQMTCRMLNYFIEKGHREFGFILGPYTKIGRPKLLYDACRDTMEKYSLCFDPERVVEGVPTIFNGVQAMEKILQSKKRPTAIFCNSDQQAIGAINAIRKAGLRVPEDISVSGFDDIEVAEYFFPKLTTVHIPGYLIGKMSILTLIRKIEGSINRPIQSVIESKIVIRESITECFR